MKRSLSVLLFKHMHTHAVSWSINRECVFNAVSSLNAFVTTLRSTSLVQTHTHTMNGGLASVTTHRPLTVLLITSKSLTSVSAPSGFSSTRRPSQTQWAEWWMGPTVELHVGAHMQRFQQNTQNHFKTFHWCQSGNKGILDTWVFTAGYPVGLLL